FRATSWDEAFPKELMLPALEATLSDLGIDLRAQENVHLDIEERPRKTPRAFCAPIEVPDRVMLVIQPIGGPDDWRALFHEAGHTEHFANTSGTSTPASTSPRTSARGPSKRRCGRSCARSSAVPGSPIATPARCCASCGARASA